MFNLRENIRLAVNGLRANKMRALLTMLGIIIGISSVITIVTVGDAVSKSVSSVFADMGANSIQIQVLDKPDENGNIFWSSEYREEDLISEEMIRQYLDAFGDQIQTWVVTENSGLGKAVNGYRKATGFVQGVNANALGIQNIDIVAGHDLNEREVSTGKNVIILSDKFVKDLFPNITMQEALGKEIKLEITQRAYTFSVVGIYHYEITGMMANMAGDTSSNLFIPISVAKDIMRDQGGRKVYDGYSFMQIKANQTVSDTAAFAQQTENYFNRKFYRNNRSVEIMASSLDSMISQMTGMLDTVKLAISVIAAISLLVGGIGVMNIMLVSVTERTREIGTRKALGAKNAAIQIQFIVESMIICMIGGAIGVALGGLFGLLGSAALGQPTWPNLVVVLIAVTFSMAIGVFFGFYPANKAAKLDPIEALRYE